MPISKATAQEKPGGDAGNVGAVGLERMRGSKCGAASGSWVEIEGGE